MNRLDEPLYENDWLKSENLRLEPQRGMNEYAMRQQGRMQPYEDMAAYLSNMLGQPVQPPKRRYGMPRPGQMVPNQQQVQPIADVFGSMAPQGQPVDLMSLVRQMFGSGA